MLPNVMRADEARWNELRRFSCDPIGELPQGWCSRKTETRLTGNASRDTTATAMKCLGMNFGLLFTNVELRALLWL